MRGFSLFVIAAMAVLALPAHADSRLNNKSIRELNTYSAAPASGDYKLMYDASADNYVKTDATAYYPATMGTTLTGNPFVQSTTRTTTAAQLNATANLLASSTGYSPTVNGFTMYSSGSVAGATTVDLQCSSGNKIATIAIAALADGVVVGPYTSGVTLTSNYINGCAATNSIQITKTGSTATGTSHIYTKLNYTWQ